MVPIRRLVVLHHGKTQSDSFHHLHYGGLVAPVVTLPSAASSPRMLLALVFFLNVPLGILAAALAAFWIPNSREGT